MNNIYHIADPAAWTEARQKSSYVHPSLEKEGFIHCSTAAQLEATANRYFQNAEEILVLMIDASQVTPPIRYELASIGEEFPHIYGPLNVDAVVKERVFQRSPDGKFRIVS